MPQTPTLRRLMRESRELSPDPPPPITPNPSFHAAPLSTNLHEWHFTLLGPPSTPYAGGLYHGRIVLPSTYPLRPPSFRFLTPSGRFEVNREICLSISGFHEESWQPAWGVRLALTALRVFMTEDGKGQVGGLEASEHVRKQLAERSREWKCAGCETEGKTNEEVMKEWWDCCRERGVQVGDDGEVVEGTGETETIPEELRLGYREDLGKKESGAEPATKDGQGTMVSPATTQPPPEGSGIQQNLPPIPQIQVPVEQAGLSISSRVEPAQNPMAQPASSPIPTPTVKLPTSSNVQSQTATQSEPGSHSTANGNAAILRTQQDRHERRPAMQVILSNDVPTPYLDKAISGIIIALLLMVLKKVFGV